MNRATPRLRALAALPFVLALAVHLLLFARWRDELPAELATHFSAGGEADGWTGPTAYVLVSTALLLGLAAGWTALVRRRYLWAAWATAGFAGGLLVQLLRANRVDDPFVTVGFSPGMDLGIALVVAVVAGAAGWALSSLVPAEAEPSVPGEDPDGGPRLPLAAGEAVGWSKDTGSRALTVLSVLALAAAPVPLLVATWPGALLGLLGLVVGVPGLALARVRVTVDRHGLTVRSALVPRPRVRVPLDGVEGASVREIDAVADFGGWGYRVRAHRTGVVLRSGEALVVRRGSGREFAVTVPDARTAAALLNALVERHGKV
ncbi:DUF1648 domain-containing protein [Streptomyces sp. WAC01280]|uniref:DUF1648 domain-containing protein n=1 Tax=Streptomyces sp. WAC01280 TaxID=2487424 RepID=UPI000F7ADCEB|nr:DUF1648 domain-containing protein [Streptomyces sp. WAC01280]RSS54066.1 DUF1648 domain-containing protein [Streptomyces sp. WAC01280]